MSVTDAGSSVDLLEGQTDRWTDGHFCPVNLSTSGSTLSSSDTTKITLALSVPLSLFVSVYSLTAKSSASQRSAQGQCICQANR